MMEIIIFSTLCTIVSTIAMAILTRIIRNILGADDE